MLKTERVTVGDKTYIIRQLPTEKGVVVLAKLSKLLGPSLSRAIGAGKPDDDVGLLMAVHGIGELCERLTPELLLELVNLFIDHSQIDDAGKVTDLGKIRHFAFSGEYGNMLLWLKANLELNYGNFLDVLRSFVPTPLPAQA